jgi:hypothetical protein
MTLPPALAALEAYPRFIACWAYPDATRPGKTIKEPLDWRTGRLCDPTNPANQTSYANADAYVQRMAGTSATHTYHLGFVFDKADKLFFLDIDDCAPSGTWDEQAVELCNMFPAAAVEVSQSGKGLHVFGRYTGDEPTHAKKNTARGLELYTDKRFVVLTGAGTRGDAGTDCTTALHMLIATAFPPNEHSDSVGWTAEAVQEYAGIDDDAELLALMLKSKPLAAKAGYDVVTFADAWNRNVDKLAVKWPSSTGGDFDGSSVDAYLASQLSYWTGKNCERIRDLMHQSALVRQKWDDRPDYLETTIINAVANTRNVYQRPKIAPLTGGVPGVEVTNRPVARTGRRYLSVEDQMQLFEGLVYIIASNQIWQASTGLFLDKARFDVIFGGYSFVITEPSDPQSKPTKSAWEAFTLNQNFSPVSANDVCFRPELSCGAIVQAEGFKLVNTYIPIETKRVTGDVSKFTNHLALMLPNARDRRIKLSWMASVIRHPGLKAQWWLVVQGAEGNAKSMLDLVMRFCIGHRYSHLVNPDAMAKTGNQFNGWVRGNLYLGIEEIYVKNRREFLDTFKSTVTNKRIAVEDKGVSQETGDNRLNGMMFTNHKDAIPITVDGRRYCIFYTAQQSAADIEAAGMTGAYFYDLYSWLEGAGPYAHLGENYGLACINDYLRDYDIAPEFDPAGICTRAPATSSFGEALKESHGSAEMEILEAVESEHVGFKGGWISSRYLGQLLKETGHRIHRNRWGDMLATLGYHAHPSLPSGRATSRALRPDMAKSRLYVRRGHLSENLKDTHAVMEAYSRAQDETIQSLKSSAG